MVSMLRGGGTICMWPMYVSFKKPSSGAGFDQQIDKSLLQTCMSTPLHDLMGYTANTYTNGVRYSLIAGTDLLRRYGLFFNVNRSTMEL